MAGTANINCRYEPDAKLGGLRNFLAKQTKQWRAGKHVAS
jgi:hypothetical protein